MQGDMLTRRRLLGLGAELGGIVALGGPSTVARAATPATAVGTLPSTLYLPDGFHPAGIAIGSCPYAYFGSLLGGAIYRIDLTSGVGTTIYPGVNQGQFDVRYMAAGLQPDRFGRLFVAGGWGQIVKVHDITTGALLAIYTAGTTGTAIDHLVVTSQSAWFTDSFNAALIKVPIGPAGRLPTQDQIVTLPLIGDWVQGADGALTATGISETPDRQGLLVVNALTGGLFRVAPQSGVARKVDLGGVTLPTTNGIAMRGCALYASEQNDVAVLTLDPSGTSGTLVDRITDPGFDVPCAVAFYRDRMYVTNSRFPLDPTPQTPYTAVAVPLSGR